MDDPPCRPQVNAVVYCSVLKGFSRARQMDRTWAVWEEMLGHGIEPAVTTFNAMIDACARNNQMEAVPDLLLLMKQRDLTPNLITFSTMLKGLCQRGDISAAFRILEEMQRAGLKPDEITYNTLLDGCAGANLADEGERLLEDMQRDGIPPSCYTLSVLVKLMGNCRKVDRAFEIVEQLTRKSNFRVNAHVYANLAHACLTNHSFARAFGVYEQMRREKMPVETRTYQALLRGAATAGNYQALADMLRAALALGTGARRASTIDDGTVMEALSALQDAGKPCERLLDYLVQDIREERPHMRIDLGSTAGASPPWRRGARMAPPQGGASRPAAA